MQNENFINGFLKNAGLSLTSGADFLKKINSKLKSPIQPGLTGKITSGVKPSSYNTASQMVAKQTRTPAQIAAQNIRHATADKAQAGISNYAQNALKSTGNAQGLRKELVGDISTRQ
jgi:hypothetical protein